MTRTREKLAWSLVAALGVLIVAALAGIARGGPLDPTSGPAPTDGVRTAGTPISSLPFTTTAGGYYYVTGPLSALPGESGITICCSNTTIDLGGFTITGAGVDMGPGDGISNAGARNIVIQNGAVRGWLNGINLGGTYSRVEGVHAMSNKLTGISVGSGSEVVDCIASLNGTFGISANGAVVRNCTLSENTTAAMEIESSSHIEGNRVNANSTGIRVDGHYNTIRNNELSDSDIFGDIRVETGAVGNVITANTACSIVNFGTNTVITGNVDRVDAC